MLSFECFALNHAASQLMADKQQVLFDTVGLRQLCSKLVGRHKLQQLTIEALHSFKNFLKGCGQIRQIDARAVYEIDQDFLCNLRIVVSLSRERPQESPKCFDMFQSSNKILKSERMCKMQ